MSNHSSTDKWYCNDRPCEGHPVEAPEGHSTEDRAQLDPNRCAVCGWPLDRVPEGIGEKVGLTMCKVGNCSMRPCPDTLYDRERVIRDKYMPAEYVEKRYGNAPSAPPAKKFPGFLCAKWKKLSDGCVARCDQEHGHEGRHLDSVILIGWEPEPVCKNCGDLAKPLPALKNEGQEPSSRTRKGGLR